MTIVKLRFPVLTMVLAAAAVPIAFGPLQQPELLPLSIDAYDILANIAGFVPVGVVLAALGPLRAVVAAALLSLFVEASQLVMLYRSASLTDVATNVLGTILGVIVAVRYNVKPEFKVTKRIGTLAAALAALLILVVWVSDRGTRTPGTGTLEAHWTFDESSGRVALDSSGHGLNGEYHSEPSRVAGPMGSAVKLDGTADYIDFGHPSALRLTSSVTISAWIKSTSFPQDDAAIVSSRFGDVGFQLDTTIDQGPRSIGFKLGNSCGTMMARYGTTPLALNTWYYVAGVYNAQAKTMDVYLNGELDNGFLVGPVTGIQTNPRKNVYVGRRSDSDGNFAGEIADVRIYSLPLTKAEIQAAMHGSMHKPQRTAGSDRDRTPSLPEHQKDACVGSPDPEDAKIPGAAATLGVLAAIACAGLFPSSRPLRYLIASLAAGLLFLPAMASTLPVHTRLMMLLLSLAGGASVAFTMRQRDV